MRLWSSESQTETWSRCDKGGFDEVEVAESEVVEGNMNMPDLALSLVVLL